VVTRGLIGRGDVGLDCGYVTRKMPAAAVGGPPSPFQLSI